MQILSLFATIITGLGLGLVVNLLSDSLPAGGKPACIHCGAEWAIRDYIRLQPCAYCGEKATVTLLDCSGSVYSSWHDILALSTGAGRCVVRVDLDGLFWCGFCD